MRTVLVAMPFQDADRPSAPLGLLTAIGRRAGFDVESLHANLDFAARIGTETYAALCDHRGRLVGEWVFSIAAFGDSAPDPDGGMLARFRKDLHYLGDATLERLRQMRSSDVPRYLDELVERYPWDEVQVVGFTSTFQQNTASFALARRLKQKFPHLVTLFGGANFEGEMGPELVRAIDSIDLAVTGEADIAFPALLSALADGRDPGDITGVIQRPTPGAGVSIRVGGGQASPLIAMDDLPIPDYDEYFERRRNLSLPSEGCVIPFESGRGCWWGAKHHCTFCGLNGTNMQWRAKSPGRVRQELAHQANRYGTFAFDAVDNILEPRYLTSLLPELAAAETDYALFYEVKANLTRAQIRVLAQAGVRHIQPGIESLSSDVLRLMNKGARSAQNVNLLKWAQYYGVATSWNLIWGFPGESEEDYVRQANLIPHLVHLRPPSGEGRVWLERFSPMFTEPHRFPTKYRRPEASYAYVYPDGVDLDRAAYFFDYEFEETLPDSAYEPLITAVEAWRRAWTGSPPPSLTYRSSPDFLQIFDARRRGHEGTYTYHGQLAQLYSAISHRPMTATAVRDGLELTWPVEAVNEAFSAWEADGLVFRDDDRVVALALPATPLR
jgi:ribosomal peptide maturation radical SAM protein 1